MPAAGSLGLTFPVLLAGDEGAVGVECGGDPNRSLRRPASCTAASGVTARGSGPGATVRGVDTTGVGVTAGGDPNVSVVMGTGVAAATGLSTPAGLSPWWEPGAAAMP